MSIRVSPGKEIRNSKGKIIETVYNITRMKGKKNLPLTFDEANEFYKEYRQTNIPSNKYIIKGLTNTVWTTLKSPAYNEEDLSHDWDDSYFESTGGSQRRTTKDKERFLGLQLVVRK